MLKKNLPVQQALDLIDGTLLKQLPFSRIDEPSRSKAQFFEVGKGGRQFAVIVNDSDKTSGIFKLQQTRILLEELPLDIPEVDGVPTSDYYNGGTVSRSFSRLAPPRQRSVIVGSQTGLRNLLEWYTNEKVATIISNPIEPTVHNNLITETSMTQSSATNTILYGPPGTGKTYETAIRAVMLCDGFVPPTREALMIRYESLRREQRISFITFHQSYGYEDFVEGLRPHVDTTTKQVTYDVIPGVFRRACNSARLGQLVQPGLSERPLQQRTIFKMSLGASWSDEGVKVFQYGLKNKCVLLGYGDDIDFSECSDEAEIIKRIKEETPDIKKLDSHVRFVNSFKNELKIGDIIIVSDGNKSFRGIAEVTGEYEFVEDAPFHQMRPVKWLAVFEPSKPVGDIFHRGFSMQTLYKLSHVGLNFEHLGTLLSVAVDESPAKPHVLIIDEINRANISKVFGELITLLEPDKREGCLNAITVKLPYSGDDFTVPANLHVIGTMNTADRSIALLDTALRRRFDFEEIVPDPSVLRGRQVEGVDLGQLLKVLNERIEVLFDRDHRIGHAFFIGVQTHDDLDSVFRRKVLPLLQEYFYENWSNVRRVLNDYGDGAFITRQSRVALPADGEESYADEPRIIYGVNQIQFPITAYKHIYGEA